MTARDGEGEAVRTARLDDHLAAVRARKRELGVVETPEYTEARRNKGANRTPEKRELLRRCEDRARAAEAAADDANVRGTSG